MAPLTAATLLPWLQKNKNLLNIGGIATAAGISPVTLRAHVSGERNMPLKTAELLLGIIQSQFSELYGNGAPATFSAVDGYKRLIEALKEIPADIREQLLREDMGLVHKQ
jgi:hypothetical protein